MNAPARKQELVDLLWKAVTSLILGQDYEVPAAALMKKDEFK